MKIKTTLLMGVAAQSFAMAGVLVPAAHADWWSRNVAPIGRSIEATFHSVVKNPVELLPVCWGSPQDCRDKVSSSGTKSGFTPMVMVSYRVDCRDRDTGADRADNTVNVSAPSREEAVARIEELIRTTDLCQANGDASRITVPGSGHYL